MDSFEHHDQRPHRPILETRKRVTGYNDDIQRNMENVMGAEVDVVEEDTGPRQQTGGTVVGYENVPSWPHEALLEPANDNEPRQLDLFYDYDNNGDAT